jgi:DNA-binding transcriptional regulator YdaS (Cro superfamily)
MAAKMSRADVPKYRRISPTPFSTIRFTVPRQPVQLVVEVDGVADEVNPADNRRVIPLGDSCVEDERRLFRALIKVSGVGPKIALALLSGVSVAEFNQSVQAQDTGALTRVPGIGRKTAERLIVEMRDRLVTPQLLTGIAGETANASPANEAYDALIALGYRPAEATRLLKAAGPGTHSTEELIRRALQSAVRE